MEIENSHLKVKDWIKVETETLVTHRASLNGAQLSELLGIPEYTRVSVRVPGCGDWSGTRLDIGTDVTLDLMWIVGTTSGGSE